MDDDWETGDFEIAKADDQKFEDEKLKLQEKQAPVIPPKPAQTEKPAPKPYEPPVEEELDPVAEKERIER